MKLHFKFQKSIDGTFGLHVFTALENGHGVIGGVTSLTTQEEMVEWAVDKFKDTLLTDPSMIDTVVVEIRIKNV